MPVLWCSISGHGFGHAAQVVPVLNELGRLVPKLSAILRTTVPASFFKPRLSIEWELSPAEQDIGCVQHGPLLIDVPATIASYERFHAEWDSLVQAEVAALRASRADLVLSDISYLAIAAGAQVGLPTIGLCNLSWDQVLDLLIGNNGNDRRRVIDPIREAYQQADLMIRIAPGLPMPAFRHITDVGPIVGPLEPPRPQLRALLKASPDERLALVGFGGIPLKVVPFDRMERMSGYRFLFDGPMPSGCSRIHSLASLPLPFSAVLASCDLLVTKPGYATIIEAVAQRKAVVYIRRHNFADEELLVSYLHRYGRGAELSPDDFSHGRWEPMLDKALAVPPLQAPPPPPNGAAQAATILAPHLLASGA